MSKNSSPPSYRVNMSNSLFFSSVHYLPPTKLLLHVRQGEMSDGAVAALRVAVDELVVLAAGDMPNESPADDKNTKSREIIDTLRRLLLWAEARQTMNERLKASTRGSMLLENMVNVLDGTSVIASQDNADRLEIGVHVDPQLRSVSLAASVERCLGTPGHVVFRKKPKRAADDATSSTVLGIVDELRARQGKDRAELYSGKTSLHPLTETTVVSSVMRPQLQNHIRCGPQAAKFIRLNAEAEVMFALHLAKVNTKLAVLRGMEDVESFVESLRLTRQQRKQPPLWSGAWCSVVCCDDGAVRLRLRDALQLDLVLVQDDARAQRKWQLVRHEWILEVLPSVVPAASTTRLPKMRIGVYHNKDVMERVRLAFLRDGFAQGVAASLRTVAAVWMDILQDQINDMKQTFFSSMHSQGMLQIGGQVGHSIAVRFAPPLHAGCSAPGFVDVTFSLDSHTVLCQCVFGTDLSSADVEDVVHGGVVDASGLLWKFWNQLLAMHQQQEEQV